MADFNNVTVVGRVGQEPELKYFQGNGGEQFASVSFTLANNQYNGQENVAHWLRVEMTGKTAELFAERVHKGNKIFVSGTLKVREYQNAEGKTVSYTYIKGFTFDLIGAGNSNATAPATPTAPQKPTATPAPQQPQNSSEAMPYDELLDIGF